jgi:hypothetical protein
LRPGSVELLIELDTSLNLRPNATVAQRPSKRCVHAVASIGTSFGPSSVTDIGSATFTFDVLITCRGLRDWRARDRNCLRSGKRHDVPAVRQTVQDRDAKRRRQVDAWIGDVEFRRL